MLYNKYMTNNMNTISHKVEEITTMQANLLQNIDGFDRWTVIATGPTAAIKNRLARLTAVTPACGHPLGFIWNPAEGHAACFDCGATK